MAEQEQPQPDQQYVIAALLEENQKINDNRIYLISVIKQMQAEASEMQAMWNAERQSLTQRIEELSNGD